jgi:hypothetical protein
MSEFITIFFNLLPALIFAGVALYMFHETLRFLEQREYRQKSDRQAAPQAPAQQAAIELSPNGGVPAALLQLELQAAERFALYLERIAPDRLVMRLHQNGMSAKMLQTEMLRAIREEFDHNLSQQVYMSDAAWKLIKDAKEEMVTFISRMGDSMPANATGIDLSRKIFETASRVEELPTDIALKQLRKDSQRLLRGEAL